VIRKFHIWLWGVVMEIEYALYPWKTSTPPSWAIERYNLPDHFDDELDEIIYKQWIKAHDEKISRLQTEMITIQREIYKLRGELEQCTKN
jgi:hypothetical protein|tara:strand:- start:1032 stop:1301 length:270 start_codon:yes stop_codon:yes gene_type:complete